MLQDIVDRSSTSNVRAGNPDINPAYLNNIELEDGETIEWSFEPIGLEDGVEPIMDLYVDNDWDDGRGVNIHYSSLRGTGTITWRVNATVGENTWSDEFTFNVTELPDGLPTFLDVPYEFCIAPNQLFDFYRESITNSANLLSFSA